MRTILTVGLSMAIGAVLGAGAMIAAGRSEAPPIAPSQIPTTPSEPLSTSDLGAQLLARVARNFVGDSRNASSPDQGVTFYTQPLPYASIFCRVDLVSIPAKIVRDEGSTQQRFVDDIEINRAYAVRRNPREAGSTDEDRDATCAGWRDFDNLIQGDPGVFAERALYLLESASSRAQSGKPGFTVTCVNRGDETATDCNGLKLLSEAGYRRVRWMKGTNDITKAGSQHRDVFGVEPMEPAGDHPILIEIQINSIQRAGLHDRDTFEIQSVTVERSVL